MSRCQGNRGVSFQKCQIALLSSHFSDNPVSLPLLPFPPPPLHTSRTPPLPQASSPPRSPEEIAGSVSFLALPPSPSQCRVPFGLRCLVGVIVLFLTERKRRAWFALTALGWRGRCSHRPTHTASLTLARWEPGCHGAVTGKKIPQKSGQKGGQSSGQAFVPA